MSVPTYLPYVILIGNGLTLFAIFYGLNRALAEASWQRTERLRALTISAVILLGWLAIALGLSGAGFYHVVQSGIPTIQRTVSTHSDRRLFYLSIGACRTYPRRGAATMDRWRPVLSGIRRRIPDPVCSRPIACPVRMACRSGRYHGGVVGPPGCLRLCASAAPIRGPRQGVERVRHSRPNRRGDTGLPHLTVRDHANCGSSLERTGDDAPHGDDPGLYGAALDPAAHHLAREIAPRAASRGRLQENGPRGSLITAQENTGPRILNGVRGPCCTRLVKLSVLPTGHSENMPLGGFA